MANHRPRHGLEGLRGQERNLRRADQSSPEVAMSGGGVGAGPAVSASEVLPAWLRPLGRVLELINRGMTYFGMLALLAAALVLTSSVVTRYLMHASTDWQDEAAVF